MRPEHLFTRLSSVGNRPSEADRADSFELAVSARRFSRRAQAVLDDKLSFSATLMRAGEVEAANRLLAEVGEEVLNEEVALLERVNEVKVARSLKAARRDTMTRGRLARTLAVAMLGASVLAFSAAGAAVVGLFREDQAIHGSDAEATKMARAGRGDHSAMRRVKLFKNMLVAMTPAQFKQYSELTSGEIDEEGLEMFLLGLLPDALAEQLHFALVSGMDALPAPVAKELTLAMESVEERAASSEPKEPKQEAPAEDETPESDPNEPSPEPSGSPEEDPSPSPDETPEDDSGLPLVDDDDNDGD